MGTYQHCVDETQLQDTVDGQEHSQHARAPAKGLLVTVIHALTHRLASIGTTKQTILVCWCAYLTPREDAENPEELWLDDERYVEVLVGQVTSALFARRVSPIRAWMTEYVPRGMPDNPQIRL